MLARRSCSARISLNGRNAIRLMLPSTRKYAIQSNSPPTPTPPPERKALHENIYTIPNLLTVSRIIATPVLGYQILAGDFKIATALLLYAGASDMVDGYLARRYNMATVVGTILDPAADKFLMTVMTITLSMKGLLPLPLAVLIIGRDLALSITAFYYRYISLPEPKTMRRYWDFSIPSAQVFPTTISKVNTGLQLLLVGSTTIAQVLTADLSLPLQALQWTVGGTTIWSGLSYIYAKDAVKILR